MSICFHFLMICSFQFSLVSKSNPRYFTVLAGGMFHKMRENSCLAEKFSPSQKDLSSMELELKVCTAIMVPNLLPWGTLSPPKSQPGYLPGLWLEGFRIIEGTGLTLVFQLSRKVAQLCPGPLFTNSSGRSNFPALKGQAIHCYVTLEDGTDRPSWNIANQLLNKAA